MMKIYNKKNIDNYISNNIFTEKSFGLSKFNRKKRESIDYEHIAPSKILSKGKNRQKKLSTETKLIQ